jgi:hypothetical protein
MHQGFEDEKGMAPALDEAPGHTTTDSTSSGQITRATSYVFEHVKCVRVMPGILETPTARPKLACRLRPL